MCVVGPSMEQGGEGGPLTEVMYILIEEILLHICKLSGERRGFPPGTQELAPLALYVT